MSKTKLGLLGLVALMLEACSDIKYYSIMKKEDFQMVVDGKATDLYTLKNPNGIEITFTNYGARVVEIWIPDRNGHFDDVVLGQDNIDAYVNNKGERFLGATIGRFGNRIAKGCFKLGEKTFQLPINDTPNSLHGGDKGFDRVVWNVVQETPQKAVLSYLSKDGEEGYPGNLTVKMTYELTDDNEFTITHEATTDKETIVNLTHHSFFNLHGAGNGTVNDHELMINADTFTPVNKVLIPTGEIRSVENSPMDFRKPTLIGERLDKKDEQLAYGHGYDHNWVLNRKTANDLELAATVYEPQSGRFMEVFTTEPGIQFYGGNFFDGTMTGKSGKHYNHRASLALETQHFPDSPNHPEFPSVILKPGENYHHVCMYKFGVK